MSLYRGAGGASDATDDSTVNAVAGYAASAATSATSAANSATSANTSASTAASSASSAASSASSVATNAANAATSASLANTYAGQASSSKDAAAASAVIASTQAGLASSSQSNAASSAATATTKAGEAATSAATATTKAAESAASAASALAIYGNTAAMNAAVAAAAASASTSSTQAANAAASAVDADESEELAYEHEQNAAEWATVAQGAANSSQAYSSASAAARDAALAALDSFDDRYLGQKAADPTVDNDGNTLIAGALYFNNQDNVMKVYEGSVWVAAYASLSGALLVNNNLSDVASVSATRTNLGLGTAATTDSTAYATAAQGTKADTAFGWGNHASAGYAADSAVVKLTGDQTVAGTKTFSSTISGSITGTAANVTGTVAIANGGTGATTRQNAMDALAGAVTSGQYLRGNGTDVVMSAIQAADVPTLNQSTTGNAATATTSTNVSGGSASVTTLTTSSTVTHNGGTANGVAYLNGSKVLTSGSALTFDGANLGISASSASAVITSSSSFSFFKLENSGGATKASTIVSDNGGQMQSRSEFFTWKNYDGSAERMTLTSTGLGIGTSSPGVKLDITDATAIIRATSSTGTNFCMGTYNNTGGTLRVGLEGSSGGSLFTGSAAYSGVIGTTSAYPLSFGTNNTERMRLDSSGNLGLGVTPSAWGSSFRAFQVARSSFWTPASGGSTYIDTNALYDSVGYKYIANGFATEYAQVTDGSHRWYNAPSGTAGNAISFTQAMTLDASGNLGVGNTSPSAKVDVIGSVRVSSGSSFYWGDATAQITATSGGAMRFLVGDASERARITSSGNFAINCTGISTDAPNVAGGIYTSTNGNIKIRVSSDGVQALQFYSPTGGTAAPVGSIAVNASTTTYNTSSDYRLKNITGPITTSGAYIDSLNPVEGTWKADGSTFVGLIAHEVQEASRTTVATGVKDGEEMQGMDYSSAEIIANLIAEVKSLRQRLAAAGI